MPTSTRRFEFLADARDVLPGPELTEVARRAEATGYHALTIPDHLIPQLGPLAGMAWIAAATERARRARSPDRELGPADPARRPGRRPLDHRRGDGREDRVGPGGRRRPVR